ncbi:hypothetical protein [Halorarum salinum]|uniref:Uncharacterized protein n=1 Tax=Halorarum salinum TaxID=2743089 RepID=A0A7D5LC60_9EURY|nr:hypothetical protein [Halobaculum salinum]QLG63048.1 hypothetical protein HUG12_15435 [Halobaculum salinum]
MTGASTASGGDEEEKLKVCPECGSSQLYPRRRGYTGDVPDSEHDYRCNGCGLRFDIPDTRERLVPGHSPGDSLAAELEAADADEVSG